MSDKSRSDDAMTVGQLIEKLREYDPDRLVLVDGYESGCTDPKIREETVVYGPAEGWWVGDYDEPFTAEDGEGLYAVVIGR
jgi:hypothetical protein